MDTTQFSKEFNINHLYDQLHDMLDEKLGSNVASLKTIKKLFKKLDADEKEEYIVPMLPSDAKVNVIMGNKYGEPLEDTNIEMSRLIKKPTMKQLIIQAYKLYDLYESVNGKSHPTESIFLHGFKIEETDNHYQLFVKWVR